MTIFGEIIDGIRGLVLVYKAFDSQAPRNQIVKGTEALTELTILLNTPGALQTGAQKAFAQESAELRLMQAALEAQTDKKTEIKMSLRQLVKRSHRFADMAVNLRNDAVRASKGLHIDRTNARILNGSKVSKHCRTDLLTSASDPRPRQTLKWVSNDADGIEVADDSESESDDSESESAVDSEAIFAGLHLDLGPIDSEPLLTEVLRQLSTAKS
ncbi:hypothetical protein C8R47DRAFT_1192037 [Mycena vitilis]|nr:hypothetical protein C8R47DRAFT_1192037 [Mycena vitilis]